MFPLSLLATAALLLPAVVALPTQPSGSGIVPPLGDPKRILCQLPILKKFLCPSATNVVVSKTTVLGSAPGVMDSDGALRFSVKYASAARWQPSTVVTSWNLPCVVQYVFPSPTCLLSLQKWIHERVCYAPPLRSAGSR